MTKVKEIQLDQLTGMRDASQKISQALHKTLATHIKTLTPLFAPRKVLGEFMESAFKDKVPGADKQFARFEERYKALCQTPFGIPPKLVTPIPNIKNQLVLYPWAYPFTIGDMVLTVRSPVRWVLGYVASYDLSKLLADQMAKEKPSDEDIKTLLLTTLAMASLMELSSGIKGLIEGLNFHVSVETTTATGDLPFIVISAPLNAFRPQDDMMKIVAQLSGTPVFEELVDLDEIAALEHPFKARLQGIGDG